MTRLEAWRRAYARQAKADLEAFKILGRVPSISESQALHALQMACEKLCKAHLCGNPGTNLADLHASHALISGPLPTIVRSYYARLGRKRLGDRSSILRQVGQLAREIELLSPSVTDGGRRPDNCEYPWEDDSENLIVPAEHHFANLGMLAQPAGFLLLKILEHAIDDLLAKSITG